MKGVFAANTDCRPSATVLLTECFGVNVLTAEVNAAI
jgi:hypothetical protein